MCHKVIQRVNVSYLSGTVVPIPTRLMAFLCLTPLLQSLSYLRVGMLTDCLVERVKGIQYIEDMLPVDTQVTCIGQLSTYNGEPAVCPPTSRLPFLLQRKPLLDIIKVLSYSLHSFDFLVLMTSVLPLPRIDSVRIVIDVCLRY
jgi:hypothetical protein